MSPWTEALCCVALAAWFGLGTVGSISWADDRTVQDQDPPRFIYVSQDHVDAVKALLPQADGPLAQVAERLRARAEQAMTQGPWSVTDHPSPAASGDPHDYFSEGPYWWPDPENPGGPYIRRDGETNPDRFSAHGRDMGRLSSAVLDLSLAAYYLADERFGRRAAELVRVWFVDEATRMNPNMRHAQAIRGRTDGRGIGIIDSVCLIRLVHGLTFLARTPAWQQAQPERLRQCFADFTEWLYTHPQGQAEMRHPNNHSSYYTAQVATYAAFVGDNAMVEKMLDHCREVLLPQQMQPDGSFPHEMSRTRSLSYSLYNTEAFALICEFAWHWGEDLWRFVVEDGRSMERALDYHLAYVQQPELWPHQQIAQVPAQRRLAWQLGAVRLDRPDIAETMRRLDAPESSILGPLELLPGGSAD